MKSILTPKENKVVIDRCRYIVTLFAGKSDYEIKNDDYLANLSQEFETYLLLLGVDDINLFINNLKVTVEK